MSSEELVVVAPNGDELRLEDFESSSQSENSNDIDLAKKEEQDAALLGEEATSDEDEFNPDEPNDLKTEAQKEREEGECLGSQDSQASAKDDEEEDDSIVCDEIELECENHDDCVELAKKVMGFVLEHRSIKASKKEALSALAEVVCDHFARE